MLPALAELRAAETALRRAVLRYNDAVIAVNQEFLTEPRPEPLEPLQTADDVAEYFGVSRLTVIRKSRAGEWPSRKIGKGYRFTSADIKAITEMLA